MNSDEGLPDLEEGEIPGEGDVIAGIEGIRLSPSEHQRIKDVVHSERMDRIQSQTRRYLVVGAGGESGAATRRTIVYESLDDRTDPSSAAFRLEDFGLTPEEIRIWIRVFDIFCGHASHIVAVLEDFDGGYVWELGLLFAPSYRDEVWVLKRRYEDEVVEREKYDNGMAVSHVKLLLTGDRCHEWIDSDELRDVVDEIP